MSRKEIEISEPHCLRHYDQGYLDAYQRRLSMRKDRDWINIEDKVPVEDRLLLYYFRTVGVHAGYYYGKEKHGHAFGGPSGFLVGDVTHWQYLPEGPS